MPGLEFYYCSQRCHKQSLMAKQARSPKATEIYKTLADAYAERASLAMDRLIHPTAEIQQGLDNTHDVTRLVPELPQPRHQAR